MQKKQVKHKKLVDFTKKKEESRVEASSTSRGEKIESSERFIEEIIEVIEQKQRESTSNIVIEERPGKTIDKLGELEKPVDQSMSKITSMVEKSFKNSSVKFIECNKQGICNDGRRISEVFEDEDGLKWQRGFLNTTRLPIFLDFLAEDARIIGRIGKAIIVESIRGSRAIVPDSFICEIISRYGILLDVDKCSNYKALSWGEKGKKK